MAQPLLQDLLEAGVHFGHQTRRWNPKMRRFIFAERSGIYIIDLQKTLRQIGKAQELLRSVVLKGEGVLFVCTKKQLKAIVQAEAQTCGAFYVTERWLGGMLTNFQTLKKQIRRLRELEQGAAEGDFENYTKKEKLLFERERVKLSRNLEGIKNMGRLPGALFVVDAKKEKIAVAEANKLGIPVVAIVDTNADPDVITVPDSGQRRRHPLGLADHRRAVRRDQGGPGPDADARGHRGPRGGDLQHRCRQRGRCGCRPQAPPAPPQAAAQARGHRRPAQDRRGAEGVAEAAAPSAASDAGA